MTPKQRIGRDALTASLKAVRTVFDRRSPNPILENTMAQSKAPKGRADRVRPFAGAPGDMPARIDSRSGKALAPVGWDRISDGLAWNPDCEKCKAKLA